MYIFNSTFASLVFKDTFSLLFMVLHDISTQEGVFFFWVVGYFIISGGMRDEDGHVELMAAVGWTQSNPWEGGGMPAPWNMENKNSRFGGVRTEANVLQVEQHPSSSVGRSSAAPITIVAHPCCWRSSPRFPTAPAWRTAMRPLASSLSVFFSFFFNRRFFKTPCKLSLYNR